MKKIASILGLGAVLALGLGSCSNEDILPTGEGRVLLTAHVNSDVKVASRADLTATQEELAAACQVWISNSKGLVRRYEGLDNVPAEGITLLSDHYIAEAWTGDSVSASWDKRWFKGRTEFDIKPNELTRVSVTCKIANVLVAVNYEETADEVLENYTFSVNHTRGGLTFEGKEERTGYFMMPTGDSELKWKLQGTLKSDGSLFTKEGVIKDIKPAYKYNVKIVCTPQSEEFGGVNFDVKVDPTEVVSQHPIVIEVAPQISGYEFDLSQPVLGEAGKLPRRSIFVKSPVALTNVVLESEDFPELLGISGVDVDLLTMVTGVTTQVKEGGISYQYMPADDGTSMMKISFEKEYVNRFLDGLHTIKITATDANRKFSTATLTYNVSDAAAMLDETPATAVWATSTSLSGLVSKEGAQNVRFVYRKQGDSEWITVPAVSESGSFEKGTAVTAQLSGLTPATVYEYALAVDDFTTEAKTLTTEAALQLPNASFEDWHGSSPLLIYADGGQQFWDSGNHGSATLKKNVTTSTSSMVKSGSLAISLDSQYPSFLGVGKFAAGNVFAGQYLQTDGTDGVLGWGRPFTARPRQLKVWAHYTPANINRRADNAPDEYVKGQPDRGIIYIALMDDHTESYTIGKTAASNNGLAAGNVVNYPVIVKTKSSELFEPDGKHKDHVIAYGQHIFEGTTPGSQLVEVTIDLDYRKTDVIPSYIVLTASASKGGDYFTGGEGSKLVLDDVELVY